MSEFNKDKFVWGEILTNNTGKQSGSAFIGILFGVTAALAFLGATIGWFIGIPDIMDFLSKVLQFASLSAVLIGGRKIVNDVVKKETP